MTIPGWLFENLTSKSSTSLWNYRASPSEIRNPGASEILASFARPGVGVSKLASPWGGNLEHFRNPGARSHELRSSRGILVEASKSQTFGSSRARIDEIITRGISIYKVRRAKCNLFKVPFSLDYCLAFSDHLSQG